VVLLFGVGRLFTDERFTDVCWFKTCAGCETVGVCTLFRATSLCGGIFGVDELTDGCAPRFDGTDRADDGRLSIAPYDGRTVGETFGVSERAGVLNTSCLPEMEPEVAGRAEIEGVCDGTVLGVNEAAPCAVKGTRTAAFSASGRIG